MKTTTLCILVLLLLFSAGEVRSDAIWNIQFSPGPVAGMQFNQDVAITFDYESDQAGGVRIFARPMAGSSLAPNYAAHGSPVYPVGTGSASGSFRITSGEVTVDAVRFQMTNADQSVLIMEFYVPVRYHYSSHAIYNIAISPVSPASMHFTRNVNITFDYRTTQAGGVRIFARPMAGSSLAPNYTAHGSPVHPSGTGNATGSFTIISGDVTVDGVRFQMLNSDQSALLLEFVVPVEYVFAAQSFSNIQFSPAQPGGMALNADVTMSFDYHTSEAGGARIFPRPYTGGALSPNYSASGSPLYPAGDGSGNASFSITTGDVTVDSVRFRMTNADQSQILLEYYVPVNYHFSAHRLTNFSFSPPPPAYLTLDHHESASFAYTTSQSGGVRIFVRPFTGGALSPGYGAHGSPLYPVGSGPASGWFHFTSASVLVDQVRLTMHNADQSQLLLEWLIPGHFQYGDMTPTGVVDREGEVPLTYDLRQNYPNPFNPATRIGYQVPEAGHVRLVVHDILGREVVELVNKENAPGIYEVEFDGAGFGSGVYFYRLEAGRFTQTRKMVLVR